MVEIAAEDQALLDLINRRVDHFETTLGNFYRDGLWRRMQELYHSYTSLRRALRDTRGRSRQAIYDDARDEFGHELFIPHAYAIVETVLPALISNRPRILILPNGEASTRNVQNMKAVIDKQQAQISLELRLQTVTKDALMLGLGVGTSRWLRREGHTTKLKELSTLSPYRLVGKTHTVEVCDEPLFDDPTFEPVRPTDFGWDPYGATIDGCRYAYQRVWRDSDYVLDRFESGAWTLQLKREEWDLANGSAERYRKSVEGAFDAQAIPVPKPQDARDSDVHEIIEYHDGGQIVTVLDRKWVVLRQPNETNYGRLPFHVYRPTEVPGQMVGKGEIEPIEDLQWEMNQMRTDRRWSDLVAMNPPIFYNDGLIDPDKIRIGPGEMNPVNGDPRDIIHQIDLKGPQNTSYRETAEIAADIVRASGISDTFAGGEAGSAATATGVQLQLARASARIQNKTRRAEIELIKPVGEHWVRLNQRHILEQQEIRVPAPPEPGQPERVWAQYLIGPNELAGNFDIEVDGGSTTPTNEPQNRQDAQIWATIMGGPLGALFDPRQISILIAEKMGSKNPESLLNAGMTVPPETLDLIVQHLTEMGIDPMLARQVVEGSLHEVLDAQDQQKQAAPHGQQEQGQGGQESPEQQQAA